MPIYSIVHRWTRSTVAVINAPSFVRAAEFAVRRGLSLVDVDLEGAVLRRAFLPRADLRGAALDDADLSACYLRKANLKGASLRGAGLTHAFLAECDLRQTDLRDADLSHADFRAANLVGADLRGTVITGARLAGALCDWRWSVVPAELLRQRSGTTDQGSRLLAALAFHEDARPWSWLRHLAAHVHHDDWALSVLADAVREGDNAPELLRRLTADVSFQGGPARVLDAGPNSAEERSSRDDRNASPRDRDRPVHLEQAVAASKMLWTSRDLPAGAPDRPFSALNN